MTVVAITLVLLQASLHSCRTYNTATPKNDIEISKPVKLPSKLIQILESLDSPDAKITKIKELIPVYNDFPDFRVKSNKKHLFMPYQKKGKPLAYILKKTYVNNILSDHTDESLDSFEDDKNNKRIYKGKPTSYRNKVYFPSSQNEKNPGRHRQYEYPKRIHLIVDGDVTNEPEMYEYDQNNENNTENKKSAEVIDDLKEPIYQQPTVSPAEQKHVHHMHRHNIENSEDKAEVVSYPRKVPAIVSEAKHKESDHYHHGNIPQDFQLFQPEIKSDDTDSNDEQIPQHKKVTEHKQIDSIPKTDKIENALDQIQAINVHKHHHHSVPDVPIKASTNDSHSLNIITTQHGHHKINNIGEENVSPKHDLIIGHHTEDPHDLVKIDADELHTDKIDAGSDLKHKTDKSNQELVATEQKSGEKEHPYSHSHSTHHHSDRKENVKDLDKYLLYLNDLDLVSPKTNIENDLNLSNDYVVEAVLNDGNPVSIENSDIRASDFNRIVPGRTKYTNNQVASGESKLDSHTSDFSASEYYSDEFGLSGDASRSSEPSSEFTDSVSDSNQESTETHENSSTASFEYENTSVNSNELVTNDSNSYSVSDSEFNSKSLEFDSLLPSSQSESGPESKESDILEGLEELPSEASNLISESVELSSESDSTNLSDEPNFSQLNGNSVVSFESPSSELGNSGSIKSSEIGLNSISGSDNSDSSSENDLKSDLSQSESEESNEVYLPAENVSVSKKLVKESSENQLNSTGILAPTILSESNSITAASDFKSKESYVEPTPTDFNLGSEVSFSSLDANATSSEASSFIPSNLETVSESYPSNIESNESSIENSEFLESTASAVFNSSSVATEESTNSNLVTASTVETPVPDLDLIVSSIMSSVSSLKSIASNLESSALSLESISGSQSIASKLNTTASDLVYFALNLESSATSLKWGSGSPIASNLMASSTESIVRSDLSTDSSITSNSESKTSNLESLPNFESVSRLIENSPSSPSKFGAFYSTIQSSINNNVHGAMKKDCQDGPVLENKISNDKKAYSMSFVFNK